MKTRIIGKVIAVVAPAGILSDMDDEVLKEFEAELKRLIGSGVTRIVVDMSEVDFVNSGGLAPLIIAHASCASRGGRFALACLNRRIFHVLEVTKLNVVLESFGTVTDAIAAVQTTPD